MIERINYEWAAEKRGGLPHKKGQELFAFTIAEEMLDNGSSLLRPLVFGRPHKTDQSKILYSMAYTMHATQQIWVAKKIPHVYSDFVGEDAGFIHGLSELERSGEIGVRYVDDIVLMAMAMQTLQEIGDLIGRRREVHKKIINLDYMN